MTLHEAVIEARYRGYNWLAIDNDLNMYAYNVKPEPDHKRKRWDYSFMTEFYFIDACETILCGNFTNWIIDLEELTL